MRLRRRRHHADACDEAAVFERAEVGHLLGEGLEAVEIEHGLGGDEVGPRENLGGGAFGL